MSGIVFLSTADLEGAVRFYVEKLGAEMWLDQGKCVILKHGNMLLGFCQGDRVDTEGVITFFHPDRQGVDDAHAVLEDTAEAPPRENPGYRIYHFYARDPEGRRIEVQTFLHPLRGHLDGAELLRGRGSVRHFLPDEVPEEVLDTVLDLCVHAPTSRNLQPCYHVMVRDRDTLEFLAGLRGQSSAPIARAPMAVAICSDTAVAGRPEQDACIAAYHFMLASTHHGLGTCWIAAMDRDDVKDALGIPREHHVATVTPLGWPAGIPERPPRKPPVSLEAPARPR